MLPRTRPRPGKCLTAVATRAERIPRTNAATWSPTGPAVEPKLRSSAPTGSFASPMSGGTTSATGARSAVTPACRSCRPQPAARRVSVAAGQEPCSVADGMVSNGPPRSRWTLPPSWSAATSGRMPAGEPAAAVASSITPAASEPPWPISRIPPGCCPVSALRCPPDMSSAVTPDITSCAAFVRIGSAPASAVQVCDPGGTDGTDGVGVGVGVGVSPGELCGGGTVTEPEPVGLPAVGAPSGGLSLHPARSSATPSSSAGVRTGLTWPAPIVPGRRCHRCARRGWRRCRRGAGSARRSTGRTRPAGPPPHDPAPPRAGSRSRPR